MNKFDLFHKTKNNILAYSDFLKEKGYKDGKIWEDIPLTTKNNYLLQYKTKELVKNKDFTKCAIIGSSSGFSKNGTVFWPKQADDESLYIKAVEQKLIENYSIDKKSTLVIVSLALGLWIGGIQLACTLRSLSEESKYAITTAITGLNLEEGKNLLKEFGELYEQVLWITNPSNISIIYSLLKKDDLFLNGKVSFPVVGEYFTEKDRENFAEKFGHNKKNPFVLWTGYGSADTGDIGIETKTTINLRKYLFHHTEIAQQIFKNTEDIPMMFELSSNAYIEILNDNKIVVTKEQFVPLIRYDTGDTGGIITKNELKKYDLDNKILENLPDTILYVFGRASDAFIFYGTNITISKIKLFFSQLDKTYIYAGLFDIEKTKTENGIDIFIFNIYTNSANTALETKYKNSLIDFLKKQSDEFNTKYISLGSAAKRDLINVNIKNILNKKALIKHKYI